MAGMKVSGTDPKRGSRVGGIVVGKGVRGGGTGLGRIQRGEEGVTDTEWDNGGKGGGQGGMGAVGGHRTGGCTRGAERGYTHKAHTHTQMCDCTHDYS